MKKLLSHLLVLGTLAMLLVSCGTSAPRYNYKELARASIRLNMDIDMKDNHQLYVESAASAPGSPEYCTEEIPVTCPERMLEIDPAGVFNKSSPLIEEMAPVTDTFFCTP